MKTPKNYGGGWAIVVGGAGLFAVGGTRFGPLAAGLTSLALLFQLVSLVGGKAGTTAATGPVGPSGPLAGSATLSSVIGTPAPPQGQTVTTTQAFNFA